MTEYKKIEEKVYSGMFLTATKDLWFGGFVLLKKGHRCTLESLTAWPEAERRCTPRPVIEKHFEIEIRLFDFPRNFNPRPEDFEELKDIKF